MRPPNECPSCGESATVMTMRGICLPCDKKVDADVATLEAMLKRAEQVRHYQDMAAEAAASVPARLGRTAETGQRRPLTTAPASALAIGAAP